MSQRILIVGAGAVGLVYARHLELGGAEVALYVKEKYAAEAQAGFTLYPLNARKGTRARLEGCAVLTSPVEVAEQSWDQVWLCISSTALRGAWLDPFLEALGEDTTLVCLQPGLDSMSYLGERFPLERLVMGMIGLISYQAPLPGYEEPAEPGVAYWFPPLSPSPFSGPKPRRDAVVAGLRAGGCPAKAVEDASVSGALGSAVLMPHLCALEHCDWKMDALRKSDALAAASAASQEALEIVRVEAGRARPCLRHAVRPFVLRLVISAAPSLLPLPFEDYMRYHFTKVGDQTRFMMGRYIERGRALDLPVRALESLLAKLPELATVAG